MKTKALEPCPKCDAPVYCYPQSGGRGTGDTTSYAVVCDNGHKEENFPSTASGRKADAEREWNKWARQQRTGSNA